MPRFSRWILALLVLAGFPEVAQAQKDTSPQSDAALISETKSIQPGTPFSVALRLKMEPHWHSYWQNPGDSGLATKIDWQLPAGFKAGPIQWPYPERFVSGGLVSYAYENEIWLLTEITPPNTLSEGTTVNISARAKWLVCKEACIPASQQLKLTLPVASTSPAEDTRWKAAFSKTRAALPLRDSTWQFTAERSKDGKGFLLKAKAPTDADAKSLLDGAQFFPAETSIIAHGATQKWARDGDEWRLVLAPAEGLSDAPKKLTGILIAPQGRAWNNEGHRALWVDAPLGVASSASGTSGAPVANTTGGNAPGVTFPLALLLAFGGGLLLNLMPCVFPVLSLKILGFVQQSGEDKVRIRNYGFAFGAGVLISFWFLAGALLLLRAGGASAGWGFQLQSPAFVAALVLLLFAVGLNLLGAFEIGVSLTRFGATGQSHSGLGGSFWSGVLATIVATPCTAPFMGSALAYALTQPALPALLVFTFLGIGMALPYVVLSFNPELIKKLPRPGAWMETFKQLMAFPIFATALWLLSVFGLQTGVEGMTYLLGALLLLGAAAWLWKRVSFPSLSTARRGLGVSTALALLVLCLASAWKAASAIPTETSTSVAAKGDWENYTPQKVKQYLSEGRPVFIDFTAAWCITCQVNKRVTLAQDEVKKDFAQRNVALLRADWTRRDAEITRALESYGRNGVPTYVLIPGKDEKPLVLPEVLSPAIVQEALAQVPSRLAKNKSS